MSSDRWYFVVQSLSIDHHCICHTHRVTKHVTRSMIFRSPKHTYWSPLYLLPSVAFSLPWNELSFRRNADAWPKSRNWSIPSPGARSREKTNFTLCSINNSSVETFRHFISPHFLNICFRSLCRENKWDLYIIFNFPLLLIYYHRLLYVYYTKWSPKEIGICKEGNCLCKRNLMALTCQIAILWCILSFMAPGNSSKETKFKKGRYLWLLLLC